MRLSPFRERLGLVDPERSVQRGLHLPGLFITAGEISRHKNYRLNNSKAKTFVYQVENQGQRMAKMSTISRIRRMVIEYHPQEEEKVSK